MFGTAFHFPGEDDVRIGGGGVVIGPGRAEQIAVGIEMQHAGERQAARNRHAVFDGGDGAP